jgi:hypothetical protein
MGRQNPCNMSTLINPVTNPHHISSVQLVVLCWQLIRLETSSCYLHVSNSKAHFIFYAFFSCRSLQQPNTRLFYMPDLIRHHTPGVASGACGHISLQKNDMFLSVLSYLHHTPRVAGGAYGHISLCTEKQYVFVVIELSSDAL